MIAARRGKQTLSKPGEYVLRAIPVYHARCSTHEGEDPGRLFVKSRPNRPATLRHKAAHRGDDGKLHVPPDCAGYRLAAATVETAVMTALREIVSDDQTLRSAIARAQLHTDDEPHGALLTDAQRRDTRRAIERLRRHHDAIWQEHVTQISRGEPTRTRDILEQEIGTIEDEIRALENTLEVDRRLRARPATRAAPPELLDLLTEPSRIDGDFSIWNLHSS